MSNVRLFVDNPRNFGRFYAGQVITGKIECNFNTDKNVNSVELKVKGKGQTEWEESERYYDNEHKEDRYKTVKYTGEESYLNVRVTLLQGTGGNTVTISAGKHTYPFSYTLPARLPSSFVGSYGDIRYYVKAIVRRSWKSNYTTAKQPLKIVSLLDLNSFPQLREPVAVSLDTTMCSCCCYDSGQLTVNISLPATGFVPGQDVSIGVHVENMTNVNVENLKFKIVKKVQFTTRHPITATKNEKSVISRSMENGVGAHGSKSWTVTLDIPENQEYPNLQSCDIFRITYQLEATVLIPFPNSNLNYKVPVIIGSIPLTGISTTFLADPPPLEDTTDL